MDTRTLSVNEAAARMIRERQRDLEGKGKSTENLFAHMVTGLCEESGEIAGLLKRHFKGTKIPKINWVEELGDVLWYLVNIADMVGTDLAEVVHYNKLKLEGRYGKD